MMMHIGNFSAKNCNGVSRRSFLSAGGLLPLAFVGQGSPKTAWAAPEFVGKAKSVIFVWLWGAPSHLDTLDPKPNAPSDIRGPFATINTRTPGLAFTELLPKLADCSQLFSVIRSHVTFSGGHPDAGTWGLTGFAESPVPVKPNFGSIVNKHRGQHGSLPPFVMVGRGVPKDVVRSVEGYGGGMLGHSYDPFMIACNELGQAEIPSLNLLEGVSPHRVHDRWSLLKTIDQARRDFERADDDWQQHHARAYQLLTDPASRGALDLTREAANTRDAYGQTAFGQSCLLARRLVEAGVSYVHVNWSEYVEAVTPNCDFGWDTHVMNFDLLPDRHCPIFDRAFSFLLQDLHVRGLLESTLVVAIGEFGRTPKINKRASRDHWQRCYSSIWAGAGIKAGCVIGASDRKGEDPVTTPITPLMVGTTIAELAGIDTQRRAQMKVLDGGTLIPGLVDT